MAVFQSSDLLISKRPFIFSPLISLLLLISPPSLVVPLRCPLSVTCSRHLCSPISSYAVSIQLISSKGDQDSIFLLGRVQHQPKAHATAIGYNVGQLAPLHHWTRPKSRFLPTRNPKRVLHAALRVLCDMNDQDVRDTDTRRGKPTCATRGFLTERSFCRPSRW